MPRTEDPSLFIIAYDQQETSLASLTTHHTAVSRAHVAPIRVGIDVGGLYRVAKKYSKRRMTNEEITKLVLTHRIGNKISEYIKRCDYHGVNERKMMNEDDDGQHENAYIKAQVFG
ncbi:hypothetical protein AVEN_154914-1 [Araneus ventricosus]|uniref:Uncharacterized protein n=1 Tax=Araneus ventricosus TaxID=182803 RepID=A0A4Y2A761_ARAVE|nr:hypothetical protein AVEN_154914-1 [Araneus ventricosus]